MTLIKNLKYYKDFLWLFYKYGDSELLKDFSDQLDMPQVLKERGDQKGKAEDLAKDLESLGPFYIKLGQILSSESQILPIEYDEVLQKLQDKARPMPYEDVESVIIEELGKQPKDIFSRFEKEPLSSASLGQVHLAVLGNNKKVAVKVQRKNVQQDIIDLLEALEKLCAYLEKNSEWGRRYHIIEKHENLKSTLLDELDYKKEANNLKILSENLKEFDKIIIPFPIDQLTTSRILTMDFIKGEKITKLSPLQKIDIDGSQLASDLFKTFLKQILVDGFFQMDPHPGNIYLTFIDKEPHLALFDLGMTSYIPFQMQGKLMQSFFAMSEGRELDVINSMLSMGKKLPEFDEYKFKVKISEFIGKYKNSTIEQIPIGKLVIKLSYIAAECGLWLPIQFSSIGKTLLSLYPILKALDPTLNLNLLLQEQGFELIRKRLSKEFSYGSLYGALLEMVDFIRLFPGKLTQIFDLFLQNDHQLKIQFHQSESWAKNFEKIANRITMGLILAALVISAALLMQVQTPFNLFGYPGFAIILFILAIIGSLILFFNILWNDRKKLK